MTIPLISESINKLIEGLKVNPLLTAGLLILAILVISGMIQVLGRQE